MVNKGNHPQMAARFRLVKYYNLPRYMAYIKSTIKVIEINIPSGMLT